MHSLWLHTQHLTISLRSDQLSSNELISGGIDLKELLKSQCKEIQSNSEICILNDADAEGYASFVHKKLYHGILLILGTGIGAGIIKNGAVYFGPDDFICRMGEIGHHLIYNEMAKSYSYYGIETQGVILSHQRHPTLMERLAGPGIAKRFLDSLLNDFNQEIGFICDYLNREETSVFSKTSLSQYYNSSILSLNLEEAILRCITARAQQGDVRCSQFICDVGNEIGFAVGVFLKKFKNEPFISHIKLAGSIGQFFGLNVQNTEKQDLFIEQIKNGILQASKDL